MYCIVYICVCMCTSFLIACLVIYWNNLNIRFWICDDREARKHGDSRRTLSCPSAHAAQFICKHMPIGGLYMRIYAICSQEMRYGTKAGAPVPLLLRTWHDLTHPDTSWCCDTIHWIHCNPWSADTNVHLADPPRGPLQLEFFRTQKGGIVHWEVSQDVTRHPPSAQGGANAKHIFCSARGPSLAFDIKSEWFECHPILCNRNPFAWFPLAETSWHQLQQ